MNERPSPSNRFIRRLAGALCALAAGIATLTVATPAMAAPTGTVIEIVNEHSKLCLDDLRNDSNPGAEVAQWGCTGGLNQMWEITDVGGGFYQIKNRNSNLCLDNFNFATAPGSPAGQWTCNANDAQRWKITDVGNGYSEIRNAVNDLCLDDLNGKQHFGAAIGQWNCNGGAVQRWQLWDTTNPRMTYSINRAENPTDDEKDAYSRIDAALSAATSRYNAQTDIRKYLTVEYNTWTETANAGLDGGMVFGPGRQYMTEGTALHEIDHTLGVGTSWGYYDKCVDGKWTGSIANALLKSWDGPDATLSCGNPHIWPYGLNYPDEFSETAFVRNVDLTEAMIADGM